MRKPPTQRVGGAASRPPVPREHGAWFILYGPMALAWAVLWPAPALPAALLFLSVTGAYFGRNALALVLRKRADAGIGSWIGIFAVLTAAGLAPLLLVFHRWALLLIALAVAAIFGLHALLLVLPARKRLDRSLSGELLAVAALTATGPAAVIVETGRPERLAWLLWALCAAYFAGGFFYVKMLLAAPALKRDLTARDRVRLGAANVGYHIALAAALAAVAVRFPRSGWILTVGFLPALVRAFAGTAVLTRRPPPLKRVGIRESLLSVWFLVFAAIGIRMMAS